MSSESQVLLSYGSDLYIYPSSTNTGNITINSVKIVTNSTTAFVVKDSGGTTQLEVRAFGGNNNIGIGLNSLQSSYNGNGNSAVGYQSLMSNTTGSWNAAFGYSALAYNTTGSWNTAVGSSSLFTNISGTHNTAIGMNSLSGNRRGSWNTAVGASSLNLNTTGSYNTATGYQSLQANTTGGYNTASGNQSLYSNTTGNRNNAFGDNSLYANTTGYQNNAFGAYALSDNTDGNDNVAIGDGSLTNNTTGDFNVAIGSSSLQLNLGGSNNSAVGRLALGKTSSGSYNTSLGHTSFSENTTGSYNTGLGYLAGSSDRYYQFVTYNNLQEATAIGVYSQVYQDKTLALGGQGADAVKVGIGTGAPTGTLSVEPFRYNAGTVSTTSGSGTVTGSGTAFTTAMIGSKIYIASNSASTAPYSGTITAVASGTSITVSPTVGFASSGRSYYVNYTGLQVQTDGNVGIGVGNGTGRLTVGGADTTDAFRVQNAAGVAMLKVDTANGRVIIGDDPTPSGATAKLYFGDYGIGTNVWVGEQSTTDTDILQLQGKNGIYMTVGGAPQNVFTLSSSGRADFQATSNNNSVFRVSVSSSGNAILSVDTNAGGVANTGYIINNGISNNENELQNPGFEMSSTDTGTSTGWYGTGITATNARTGNNSYSLTEPSDSPEVKWHPVQPGDVIYFEGWVKRAVAATGTGGFFVKAVDQNFANTAYSTGDVWTDPGTTYTLRSNRYTVPAGKYYVQFVTTVRSGATGTWYFDDVFMNIANKRTPTIFKNSVDSTTAFQVQNAAGNTLLNVATTTARGFVSVALGNAASTNAVCSSLANGTAPTANTAYQLRDCNAAPAADYAEMYPVANGTEYGDIVAIGTEMVNTYDETDGNVDWNKVKGQVTRLVKTSSSYQANVIGIVSNNYGDFTSAGHNIKEEDNPMPVALNGRVPVKISAASGSIQPGDYITTSPDTGKAQKAEAAGTVIGKALEAWDPLSGKTTVMVYVEQGYYPGPPLSTVLQGASLDISGSATINGNMSIGGSLNVSGNTTLTSLTVNGNAIFNGNLTVENITVANITINGHIITAGNVPVATAGTAAGTE
ncbi:MAG TPA: hypothetical protein PLJ04_02080, partial [Candidatus Saccharibacteria bacterium]|nr:hypothetical protein [Candidatus Saccharibacteria bacterium]